LAWSWRNSPSIASASGGTHSRTSSGISLSRSPFAARERRAMAASIAPAVAAMVRSAEAQHITPQMIAAISARPALSALTSPREEAASARMNATAPAHIANAMARLLSENPST
jgi:hypothetical protein